MFEEKGCMGCGTLSVLGLCCLSSLCLSYCTHDSERITVVDKYIKTEDRGSSKGVFYIVGQKENGEEEVFSNEDSLPYFKFNSADVHQKIKVGQTYKADVNWMRIPFLSMYRNILEAEEISDNDSSYYKEKTQGTDSLESKYAGALLKLINENQSVDVSKLIEAHTTMEAAKDPQNISKIKSIGNKYYKRYMEADSLEAFKEVLKKAIQGEKVAHHQGRCLPVALSARVSQYQRA